MLFASIFTVLAISAQTDPDPIEYGVFYRGKKSGYVRVTRTPDGLVVSDARFEAAKGVCEERLTQQYNGAQLITNESSIRPGTQFPLTDCKELIGALIAPSRGTGIPIPQPIFLGAAHVPYLWESSVEQAANQLDRHPRAVSVAVIAYMADKHEREVCLFRRLTSRRAVVDGRPQLVRTFQIANEVEKPEVDLDLRGNVVALNCPSENLRIVLKGWEGLFEDDHPKYAVATDDPVITNMQDDTELVSIVVRPNAPGQFPTIVSQTNFGKMFDSSRARFFAERGYVFVTQDFRGTGASKGKWQPFTRNKQDSIDLMRFITNHPWSNGKVGVIGTGYGADWVLSEVSDPDSHVKCGIAEMPIGELARSEASHLPHLYDRLWWDNLLNTGHPDAFSMGPMPHLDALATLPLNTIDQAIYGRTIPLYQSNLVADQRNHAAGGGIVCHVPTLEVEGTGKSFLAGKNSWQLLGPWKYCKPVVTGITEVPGLNLNDLYLNWFDRWLGKPANRPQTAKTETFAEGAHKWIASSSWPPANARPIDLFLTGGEGSRSLKLRQSRQDASDQFEYDPKLDTSVETVDSDVELGASSRVLKDSNQVVNGGFLTFKGPKLAQAETLAGPAKVSLWFRSSAGSTDLFGCLVDIDSNGKRRLISGVSGIRGSNLSGSQAPLDPNRTYQASFQTGRFAYQLERGHSLGFVISSSMFPLYSRNLGSIEPVSSSTTMKVQRNKILFGPHYPSDIKLFVLSK